MLNHLEQTVSANQPQYNATAMNGMPGIVFDGSNDALRSNPANYPGWPQNPNGEPMPFAVFYICKPPPFAGFPTSNVRPWSGFHRSIGGTNQTYTFDYWVYGGNPNPVGIIGVVGGLLGGGLDTFGADYTVYSGAGTPKHPSGLWLNGTVFNGTTTLLRRTYGSTVGSSVGSATAGQLHGLCLGADGNGGTPSLHSATTFGEFIVVRNANAATQSVWERIEGYLAWKWGVQGGLPVGHPYKTEPPR
ncbi:MAG: hypothetical protein ACK5XN_39085 [Bacteroidota bacterium]